MGRGLQPKTIAAASSKTKFKTPPIPPTFGSENKNPKVATAKVEPPGYSSNLSPPLGSEDLNSGLTPSEDGTPAVSAKNASFASSTRVVPSSDDEDSDSDSELPDLRDIFPSSDAPKPTTTSTQAVAPSTPSASRYRDANNFHCSPLAVLPKYKYDLKALISQAESEEATEASSKRVKAMLAEREAEADPQNTIGVISPASKNHRALLASVVGNDEEGGFHKVTRALDRTETTHSEKRWYFFEAKDASSKGRKRPFPTITKTSPWVKEFSNSKVRTQIFMSGFVEDMVAFGKALPDEIFLWILDEACFEISDVLRTAYFNILRESKEQIHRLLSPKLVKKMFRSLGGTEIATSIVEKVRASSALNQSYSNRDWSSLRSVMQFFMESAESLQQNTREHVICMVLRINMDDILAKIVDLHDLTQATIRRLCWCSSEESWENLCQSLSKILFETVTQPFLRLQIVEAIPCVSLRTHDLRRRLAMCFYFDDLSYSQTHSYTSTNLDKFIDRIEDPIFKTTPETDYRELGSLIALLDIAVDDGRSPGLDLTDKVSAEHFDEDVDYLVAIIKEVMRGIGNPGAAFISKIEAKEKIELVSQRIADTIRSKPKPRLTHFDMHHGKLGDNLKAEKAGMSSFLSKMKGVKTENTPPVK
ncbi:hypothetical protein BGZ60DRAFT_366389 [Tricladium varicosporioides]|nr:hypothetical protein BGZ60DRAFT_366389 [Hymenoscyphus varicosporioides]